MAPLSPQSMSAEIEQLDAMANNAIGGDSASSRAARKVRNVKQPVSYAEPSTKSKLRRGVSFVRLALPVSLHLLAWSSLTLSFVVFKRRM